MALVPLLGGILDAKNLLALMLMLLFCFNLSRGISSCAWLPWITALVPGSLRGKFLVRGGQIEHMEGEWRPKRVVVVEFESLDKARAFHQSPEYAEAMKIRQRTSVSSVIIVQGA